MIDMCAPKWVHMTTSVSSILVLIKFSGEDTDLNTVIGDAKILWSGERGFEWIGKGGEDWDSVHLLGYKNRSECLRAVERFREEDFARIKLLLVDPLSSFKIRVVRFLMKYVYSRTKVTLVDIDMDSLPQSDVLPTMEQHQRLAREDKGQPVVMVNLMSYNDQPLYPESYEGKRSKTGEDAYNQYYNHAVRAVASLGGALQWAGRVEEVLIGDQDEEWHQFGLMGYPSRSSLQSMFRIRENPEAGIQRDAGLKATRVYAFTPK